MHSWKSDIENSRGAKSCRDRENSIENSANSKSSREDCGSVEDSRENCREDNLSNRYKTSIVYYLSANWSWETADHRSTYLCRGESAGPSIYR